VNILADCPALLGEWTPDSRDARTLDEPPPLWKTFAGQRQAWSLECEGTERALLLVVERAEQSQFDQLVELARSGAELPDSLACVAIEGENFHGQSSRPWTALRGNLHLSCYRRLGIPAAGLRAEISILPTLALVDACGIQASTSERTGIRWVNDLFVRGRKVAGTITSTQLQGDRVDGVVYGIGLNVEQGPAVEPSPWVPATTSLREAWPEGGWTVPEAAWRLLEALDRRLEELREGRGGRLIADYVGASACLGHRVRVWPRGVEDFSGAGALAAGRLLAIHEDLSLCVEGAPDRIPDGRLAFEEDCRELGL